MFIVLERTYSYNYRKGVNYERTGYKRSAGFYGLCRYA